MASDHLPDNHKRMLRRILIFMVPLFFFTPTHAKELRLGLITPPSHAWTKAANRLGETLKKDSKGELQLTVFHSRQLGNEASMLSQMQTGALDMAFLTVAEISNRVPNFGAFYAPYLVKDVAEAAKLLRSEPAQGLLNDLPKKIGVKGIGYGMAGMRQMLTRDTTKTLNDLRGKKLRITPFAPIKDFYTLLGVAATPMPLPNVYEAMANGQVDGMDMDIEMILKLKFHTLAKSVLLTNHMMFPMVGVVSMKTWNSMTPEEQSMIASAMKTELSSIIDFYVQQEEVWSKDLKKTNTSVQKIEASFFEQSMKEWDSIWAQKAPALTSFRKEVKSYH